MGLKGVQQRRSISETFEQLATGQSLIDLWHLDLIVGSGGVLSHAPRRVQTMLSDRFGVDKQHDEPIISKCVIVMGMGLRVDG